MRRPGAADAAVLQVPEAGKAIAVAIDGNGRRVACDPYRGTVEAVLECAQNLACTGAEPLGLTNCLNFGNPEKPGPAWQLERSVSGLADACEALGVPVVGGNVSLYNEGPEGPIYPTPVVGMVGEVPSAAAAAAVGTGFRSDAKGDAIALVGPFAPSLAGSELAKLRGELGTGLPGTDIERRRRGDRRGARGGARRHRSPPPTTSATAAWPARSPSARSPAGSAAASTSTRWSRPAGARGRAPCSARGRAASSSAASASALEAIAGQGVDVLVIGEVGGEEIAIEAAELSVSVRLADARSAWESLAALAEPDR